MPGESPGRDWDALLNPTPPTVFQQRAMERARTRARWRMRAWKAIWLIVIGGVFLLWLALLPRMFSIPLVGDFLWFVVLLPAMLFITGFILRRLERLLIPSAERELDSES